MTKKEPVVPSLDLDSPTKLRKGDRFILAVPPGADPAWSPPVDRVDAAVDPVVVYLDKGQPGPFLFRTDRPITVQRG